VKMLPIVLAQVRAMIGKRRLTVVFDRGGYSPKLFLRLIEGPGGGLSHVRALEAGKFFQVSDG